MIISLPADPKTVYQLTENLPLDWLVCGAPTDWVKELNAGTRVRIVDTGLSGRFGIIPVDSDRSRPMAFVPDYFLEKDDQAAEPTPAPKDPPFHSEKPLPDPTGYQIFRNYGKREINNLLWDLCPRSTTLDQANFLACAIFDQIAELWKKTE